MKYGLSEDTLSKMQAVFLKHPKIEKVILYGSRAKGTHHEGSDIDLTLVGDTLELADLYAVDEGLDLLDLPYTIDLSLYGQISNDGLIGHVNRIGKRLYERSGWSQPLEWQIKPLNEIAKIKGGKRIPKGDKLVFENTGFPYIRVADFTDDGTINLDNIRYITGVVYEKIKNYTIDSADLYISIAGTIGKAGIVPTQLSGANLTENACKLVFEHNVVNRYVYYFTQTNYFLEQTGLNTRVAAMPKLALSRLGTIKLPIPPIPEQKRIVAILDQVFAEIYQARAHAQQNLNNARELFESYLQQVFSQRGDGWIEHILGDICTFKHGFAFKSQYFKEKSNLVLLTPGNFFEKGGYKNRGEKQKYYEGPFPEEFLLVKGSLLVAMTEQAVGLLGSPALIPEDNIFLHNQRLGLVELTESFQNSVKTEFLFHLFNTSYFRSKVQETASGVKVRHTSPKKMQAISIWIPDTVNKQDQITQKIFKHKEQTIALENIYQKKMLSLDELKKSILQKAFTGELTQESKGATV